MISGRRAVKHAFAAMDHVPKLPDLLMGTHVHHKKTVQCPTLGASLSKHCAKLCRRKAIESLNQPSDTHIVPFLAMTNSMVP